MRLLLLGLLCCVFWTAQAQRSNLKKLIRKDVKELSRIYELDKEQKEAVLVIQEQYYIQLEEIAGLKDSDQYRAYLYKLKSIRMGNQFELKKILRPDQWPAFEAERTRQEQEYLNKLATLKASGATKEKIDLARIAIE